MNNQVIRLPLDGAIASILSKREHKGYREVGQNMTVKDLYKLLGLTGSPMLYNYMSGKTKAIEPERALVIFEKFGVLIDDWLTSDELIIDATNVEISKQIAQEPIKEVMEALMEVEQLHDTEIRHGIRKLIARFYR